MKSLMATYDSWKEALTKNTAEGKTFAPLADKLEVELVQMESLLKQLNKIIDTPYNQLMFIVCAEFHCKESKYFLKDNE